MKDNLILETIKKFPLEDIEQFVENLLDKKPVQKDTPIGDFISKCNISLDTRGSASVNYFVFMHTFLAYLCCGLIDRIKNPVPAFFVSGHRDITEEEFDTHYKKAIDNVIKKHPRCRFVVGDYHGVDIMAQDYLVEKGKADDVTVYHMFKEPRNHNNAIKNLKGGFKTDEERDSAMTDASDYDIAIVLRDKWNSGTAQNLLRRAERNSL